MATMNPQGWAFAQAASIGTQRDGLAPGRASSPASVCFMTRIGLWRVQQQETAVLRAMRWSSGSRYTARYVKAVGRAGIRTGALR